MNIKHRHMGFKIKSVEKDGTFAGYGSVFGNADFYNDVVMPGAFQKSLSSWQDKDALPPILWQHASDQPIGPFTHMSEDGKGLYVEGQLLIDDVQQAKEAYALIKSKTISGMSIGYDVPDGGMEYDGKTNVWKLNEIDLWEVSICTFPANIDAQISEVKSLLGRGQLPSLKQFEGFLREAGFSKTRAVAVANHGLSRLLQREADGDKSTEAEASSAQVDSVVALIEKYQPHL